MGFLRISYISVCANFSAFLMFVYTAKSKMYSFSYLEIKPV